MSEWLAKRTREAEVRIMETSPRHRSPSSRLLRKAILAEWGVPDPEESTDDGSA